LRFLPKGNKIVVLGLITTKSGKLEKKDDVKRRIDEDEQWAKLRMVVELADEVWR
jgi:5-methyltetrahydropteroyltriglutamate--homocysteine methyltransferase